MKGEKKQMAAPTSSRWMEMEYKVSSRRNTKQRNDGKKEREKKNNGASTRVDIGNTRE